MKGDKSYLGSLSDLIYQVLSNAPYRHLGLEQARLDGFEVCYINWISPSLLASRFWPRFGFKDVAYRVARMVNPMIAWARGKIVQ